MSIELIALFGDRGAGKDTVAKILREKHDFEAMSFTGPLREALWFVLSDFPDVHMSHFFGTTEQKETPIPSLGGTTGRDFLTRVGTEGFRSVYPDIWVDLLFHRFRKDAICPVVISDIRFPNEYEKVKSEGGKLWLVEAVGRARPKSVVHESEEHWRSFKPDAVIENPWNRREQLEHNVRMALEEMA